MRGRRGGGGRRGGEGEGGCLPEALTMGVSLCLRRTSIVPRVRRIPIDDKHSGTIANIDTQDICSTWTINQSINQSINQLSIQPIN